MKLEVILDRIEGSVAVLIDKSDTLYSCDVLLVPEGVTEGAALYAFLDTEGKIVSVEKRIVPEEKRNRRRLSELFVKNPKNKL